MDTHSPSSETKKLPSNKAVRDILAYYVALCAEKGLDPHTAKPLRTKSAKVRKAAVRTHKVLAPKL